MRTSDNLIWIDMEMTGLNPKKDKILEIAAIITDSNLKSLDETKLVIHWSKKTLNKMGSWCKGQHAKSGLTKEVLDSRTSLKTARKKLSELIRKHCARKRGILCGSSVYVDRIFLKRYFPRIDSYLDYAVIDVSSVGHLVKRWYPEIWATREVNSNHRALDDVRASIKELEFYRKIIFR